MAPTGGIPDWLGHDLATGGLILAAIAVVSTITTLLTVLAVWVMGSGSTSSATSSVSSGSGPNVGDLAALWVQLLGLPLFGGANLTSQGGINSAFLQYLPGFMTLAIGVATYLVHLRRARSTGRPALAARSAAVAAGLAVLAVLLLTTLVPFTSGAWRLAVHPVALLFLGTPALFAVGYVAQARRDPAVWGPLRGIVESPVLRRSGVALTTHAVVSGVLVCVGLGGYLVFTSPWRTTLGLVLLAPLVGAGLLTLGVGFAHGGSIGASGAVGIFGGSQSTHLLSAGVPRWLLLLLLVPVIATVVTGLRVGLGMPVGWHAQWRDAWVTPVALLLGWLVIDAVLGQASVEGSARSVPLLGTVAGGASFGLSAATALIVGSWGLVVEVSARVLAPSALRAFPSLPALLRVRSWAPASTVPAPVGVVPPGPAGAAYPVTTSATGGASPSLAQAVGAAAPLSPQQRKRLTIASLVGVGIVGVFLLGAGAISWISANYFGPQLVVKDYLSALEDGDAAKANELADPGIANADRAGLSAAVLSGATKRIDSVSVSDPIVVDSGATVRAQYSLDGVAVTTVMRLERSGSTFGVFPTWRLVSNLARQVPVSSPTGITIGDTVLTEVPADSSSFGNSTVYLYPGIYEITGAKNSPVTKWLRSSTERLAVTSGATGGSRSIRITVTPTAGLADEVTKMMHTLIDDCAKTGAARPQVNGGRCPFSTYSSDDKATWTVISYPELKVDISSGRRLDVSSTKSGSVQVTTKGFSDTPYTTTDSVTIWSRSLAINLDGTLAWAG
ncbi:MAG: hypothetical protein V9G08_00255 [Dermatophilaceae bacterium]